MDTALRDVYAALSNAFLHLIVMPTEACNFRCKYCYEDFALGRMRPEIVGGLKQLLDRRAPELQSLTLSWFGGEPLLARDVVRDILRHVSALRLLHPRLQFSSDITTNGWFLTPELVHEFAALGLARYQVSVDGPREWHDRTRVRAGGGATFDRIWNNLRALRALPDAFVVLVRLHASRDNATALHEFVAEYGAEFGPDPRFKLLLRKLSPLGGAHDADFPFLDDHAGANVLDTLEAIAAANGVEALRADHLQPVCYAARGNSFVVRADGRLGKCTVALDHPANDVGRLHADGRVDVRDEAMRPWMRGLFSGDARELECPMRGHADPARVTLVRGLA